MVVPEPLARQAAEPRAAQAGQVKHPRCRRAAHKRMVAAAAVLAAGRMVLVVLAAAAQPTRVPLRQQERQTRAAVGEAASHQLAAVLAVLVAQGSSWYERSSVALLRVS